MGIFKKYRNLYTEVEAARFDDQSKNFIFNEMTGNKAASLEDGNPVLLVTTAQGTVESVRAGEWIISDKKIGTYYKMSDESFNAKFL